jgi:asparagine synthase (glutamine-hydrolysing)
MCGIAGFISKPNMPEPTAIDAVKKMADRMQPRGPDADGMWSSEGVTFAHRRLAILDLDSRANQPMASIDGRYTIIFNGEIYNFQELRSELQGEGVAFRTNSDTEVLLTLFERDGVSMLDRLRGMFAFAIWDTQSRELFLARDPYGIKPLYYSSTKDGLLFASTIKALLASRLVSKEREPAGLAGFYLWGSVPEPWTLYRDVLALPAGHWMRVIAGVPDSPVCWHDIRQHWRGQNKKLSARKLQEKVQQAVTDSVRDHLVADVPVCVFLSGGIDSATLAGQVAGLGTQVEGITISFDEFTGQPENEVPVAEAIASHYGLQHSVRQVSRAEFEEDIPYILDAMDQPSIDGVNTWFASKAAAERGYKVVLSGVGGDELFGGYSSFKQIPRMAVVGSIIAAIPGARALLITLCGYFAKKLTKAKFAAIPMFMDSLEGSYFLKRSLFLPEELPALMGVDMASDGLARLGGSPPGMSRAEARDSAAAIGLLESKHYLCNQLIRDSDWASMAHSLELRTPLVDATLLETLGPYVSGFKNGAGKVMLASSPEKSLPESIINRSKTGFSLPMAQWLSDGTDRSACANVPLLSKPETSWARLWAKVVVERIFECE